MDELCVGLSLDVFVLLAFAASHIEQLLFDFVYKIQVNGEVFRTHLQKSCAQHVRLWLHDRTTQFHHFGYGVHDWIASKKTSTLNLIKKRRFLIFGLQFSNLGSDFCILPLRLQSYLVFICFGLQVWELVSLANRNFFLTVIPQHHLKGVSTLIYALERSSTVRFDYIVFDDTPDYKVVFGCIKA